MKRLATYDDGSRHVLLRGASDLLRETDTPAMWSAIHRAHQIRRERLPDILAAAQEAGYAVTIKTGRPAA